MEIVPYTTSRNVKCSNFMYIIIIHCRVTVHLQGFPNTGNAAFPVGPAHSFVMS